MKCGKIIKVAGVLVTEFLILSGVSGGVESARIWSLQQQAAVAECAGDIQNAVSLYADAARVALTVKPDQAEKHVEIALDKAAAVSDMDTILSLLQLANGQVWSRDVTLHGAEAMAQNHFPAGARILIMRLPVPGAGNHDTDYCRAWVDTYIKIGNAYVVTGGLEAARAVFDVVFETVDEEGLVELGDPLLVWRLYLSYGRIHYQLGDSDRALVSLEAALDAIRPAEMPPAVRADDLVASEAQTLVSLGLFHAKELGDLEGGEALVHEALTTLGSREADPIKSARGIAEEALRTIDELNINP